MRLKQGMVLAVIVAVALAFFTVHAQTQAAESSGYQAIADKFFALLEQGKSEDAIDYAFNTNAALRNLPGKSDQLKAQFGAIESQIGSYHAHARLAETKVAGMFVYQHYFVAYERQPISIRLKFYKARDTWRVYAVAFDADLPDLIEKQTDQNLDRQLK